MKSIILAAMFALALGASAQDKSVSSSVSRGSRVRPGQTEVTNPGVSLRKQQQEALADGARDQASMKYMRVVYRELDLQNEDANSPLYFPEDLVDGQENLFRIMFRLFAENKVPAYEYLDGREDFSEENRAKMSDIISRFGIYAKPAKGSTEKNPTYEIAPVDVPTNEVLAYYIIERWEFDNRTNRMRTVVEAICPVVVRDDAYAISGKTPMFWMKMSDLKPYLQAQYIFTDDDNNLASHTYDDFFTLNLYKGDIYKTRNLRNRTLVQIVGDDPDDLKRAQDSIQNRLEHYADNLWVPSREEIARQRELEEALAAGSDTVLIAKSATPSRSKRSARKPAKSSGKEPKKESAKPKASPASANKSVRNRRR